MDASAELTITVFNIPVARHLAWARFSRALLPLLGALAVGCSSQAQLPATQLPHALPVQQTGKAPTAIDDDTLTLATLNIAHGRGDGLNQLLVSKRQTEANLATIGEFLRAQGIHIAALQEADAPSFWSGSFDHARRVAELGLFPWFAHAAHADLGIGVYGTAVLSRLPMNSAAQFTFSPSPPTAHKGFTLTELKWRDGTAIDVFSVHLDFSRQSVRLQQIAELGAVLRQASNPVIIMGDFNSENIIEELASHSYHGSRHLHTWTSGEQSLATYKNKRLDWIILSSDLEFVSYSNHHQLLSDHRAVIASVRLIRPHSVIEESK